MESLYDELLIEIFDYLSIVERFRLTRVCHRFRHLVQRIPVYALRITYKDSQTFTSSSSSSLPLSLCCNERQHQPSSYDHLQYEHPKQLQQLLRQLLPQVGHRLQSLLLHCPSLDHLLPLNQLKFSTHKQMQVLRNNTGNNIVADCNKKENKRVKQNDSPPIKPGSKRSRMYRLLSAPFNTSGYKRTTENQLETVGNLVKSNPTPNDLELLLIESTAGTFHSNNSERLQAVRVKNTTTTTSNVSLHTKSKLNCDQRQSFASTTTSDDPIFDLPALLQHCRLAHFELHLDRLHRPDRLIPPSHSIQWFQRLLQVAGRSLRHLTIHNGPRESVQKHFAAIYPTGRLLERPVCIHCRRTSDQDLYSKVDSFSYRCLSCARDDMNKSSLRTINENYYNWWRNGGNGMMSDESPMGAATGTTTNVHQPPSKLSSFFGQSVLEQLQHVCPSLQHLHYQPLSLVTESLQPIQLPTMLHTIYLPNVRLTATELDCLLSRNSNQLRELSVFDLNASLLRVLCQTPLKKLRILRMGKLRLQQTSQLLWLQSLCSLDTLELKLHYKFVDDVLPQLCVQLPLMRDFRISNALMSLATVQRLVAAWPQLERLELRAATNQEWQSDRCVQLLRSLSQLQVLSLPHLNWCQSGLTELISWLTSTDSCLKALDLSHARGMTLDTVLSLMSSVAKMNTERRLEVAVIGLGSTSLISNTWPSNLTVLTDPIKSSM